MPLKCGLGLWPRSIAFIPFLFFAFLPLTSDDKDINNDYDNLIE